MHKLVSFIGSKHYESLTKKINFKLVNELEGFNQNIQFVDLSDYLINECIGCGNCFRGNECAIIDDMEYVKAELLDSDIVVIGTPVYFKGVSSTTKKIIDRLSYWTHRLKLVGKQGVILVTTDSTGADETVKYLFDFAVALGLCNIQIISYKSLVDTKIQLNTQINFVASKVLDFVNLPIPQSNRILEKRYKKTLQYMELLPHGHPEKIYLQMQKFDSYTSLQEYFFNEWKKNN